MDTSVFLDIYAADRWSGGSGPGSTPAFCKPVVNWLVEYIRQHRVESLVDIGCGDLQWMPSVVALTGIRYTGLDVVPSLIKKHRVERPGWRFELLDATQPSKIPRADLYWCKDVLQHWPTADIERFLDGFFRDRPDAHLVTCNCAGQPAGDRVLDTRWHFCGLDGDRPPLEHFRPARLFAWDSKHVYRLHQRSPSTRPLMSDAPSA